MTENANKVPNQEAIQQGLWVVVPALVGAILGMVLGIYTSEWLVKIFELGKTAEAWLTLFLVVVAGLVGGWIVCAWLGNRAYKKLR